MLKKTILFVLIFIFFIPAFFYIFTFSYSQSITLSDEKVIYDLPYAGILPDNPLYFAKQIRDAVLQFVTRDQMKKAEMLLLSSDKKIHMAIQLSEKGKNNLMLNVLREAEKQSLNIPRLIKLSKNQGVGPKEGFIYRLKLSNVKHKEVLEELIKELPQGQETEMTEILELNKTVRTELEKL